MRNNAKIPIEQVAMSDQRKQQIDERDQVERDIEEFKELSGKGNSSGWKFDREEIHERDKSSRDS
jgi:hypothetical protein